MTHREWEWLETSLVSIGANQEALRNAIDGSHSLKSVEGLLIPKLPTQIGTASGSYRGVTDEMEGHTHSFMVEIEDGRVVHAATSEDKGFSVPDHFHWISRDGSTDPAEGHTHTFSIAPAKDAEPEEEKTVFSMPAIDPVWMPVAHDAVSAAISVEETDKKALSVRFGWKTVVKASAITDESHEGTSKAAHLIHHGVAEDAIGPADLDLILDCLKQVLLFGSVYSEKARDLAYEHLASHLSEFDLEAPPFREYGPEEWEEVEESMKSLVLITEVRKARQLIDSVTFDFEDAVADATGIALEQLRLERIRGQKQ